MERWEQLLTEEMCRLPLLVLMAAGLGFFVPDRRGRNGGVVGAHPRRNEVRRRMRSAQSLNLFQEQVAQPRVRL